MPPLTDAALTASVSKTGKRDSAHRRPMRPLRRSNTPDASFAALRSSAFALAKNRQSLGTVGFFLLLAFVYGQTGEEKGTAKTARPKKLKYTAQRPLRDGLPPGGRGTTKWWKEPAGAEAEQKTL